MRNTQIYQGKPKEGFFVFSSSGCGDSCSIRLVYIESPDDCSSFWFDTNTARELAHLLIKVADDYDKGIETEAE